MSFENSQEHGSPHHFFTQLAGAWQGESRTWLDPIADPYLAPILTHSFTQHAHVLFVLDQQHVNLFFQFLCLIHIILMITILSGRCRC